MPSDLGKSISIKYKINDCIIEPRLNRAIKAGVTHALEPRVMDVLTVLIKNSGKLVFREEIIKQVWKNRAVSDSSLNRNIAKLRKLLDDQSCNLSPIKTIPKKGYMLQAEVRCLLEETEFHDSQSSISNVLLSQNGSVQKKSIKQFDNSNDLEKKITSIKIRFLASLLKNKLAATIISIVLISIYFVQNNPHYQKMLHFSNDYSIVHNITLSPNEEGKAFCLDGLDDYIEVTETNVDIGENDFSMSAWIKTRAKSTVVVIDKRNESYEGNVRGFNLHLLKGKVGVQLADGDGNWLCLPDPEKSSCTNFNSSAFVADNQWHFIAVTVDRDDLQGLKFYVDGRFIESHNPTIRKGSLTTPRSMRIGSRSSSKSALFPGLIGEVTIGSGILSDKEIRWKYELGINRDCL